MKRFEFLTEAQVSMLQNMLLTEASAISLHQQFDKIFGRDVIESVLSVDSSPKKKFAEWVLKSSMLTHIDGEEIVDDYITDGTLKKLFDLTMSGKFQALSYDNLKAAYDAMAEYEEANADVSPAFEDDTIAIYVPSSYMQLRAILKRKYGKTADEAHWCVVGSSADENWSSYSDYDEYHFYLIYNKDKQKLFLWNDNPDYAYKMFNNWNDEPCSPFSDGGLTDEACKWLEHVSGTVSIYDVEIGVVLDYLLDGMAKIIDKNEDDLYYHDVDLYSDDNIICRKWCYSKYALEIDKEDLAIVQNDDVDDYSVAFRDKNGNIQTLPRIDGYNNFGDFYFFNFRYGEFALLNPSLGIFHKKFDINAYAVDNFTPIDEACNYAVINDGLYGFLDGEFIIRHNIASVLSFDCNKNIVTLQMDEDFDEDELYYIADDGYEDLIQHNVNIDYWVISIDLTSGAIVSIISPR